MEAWFSRHAFTPKRKRFSPASCCIVQWEGSFWSTSGASPFCRLRATRHLSEERWFPSSRLPSPAVLADHPQRPTQAVPVRRELAHGTPKRAHPIDALLFVDLKGHVSQLRLSNSDTRYRCQT